MDQDLNNAKKYIGKIYSSEDPAVSFNLIEQIGKGCFSGVFLCQKENTEEQSQQDQESQTFAIKINFDNQILTEYKRAIVLNEMKTIREVQGHPNVIKLISIIEKGYVVFANSDEKVLAVANIVLEVLRGGELFYHIKMCQKFSIETSLGYFKQLVTALLHINKLNLCHRDLKPWNIMVTKDLSQLKIIDFGYATPLNIEESLDQNNYLKGFLSGTKSYTSPELFKKQIDSKLDKADVFSLGVVLFNLLTGKYPFYKAVNPQQDYVLEQDYLDFLEDPSLKLKEYGIYSSDYDCMKLNQLSDLLRKMLLHDITERISFQEILQHDWVTSTNYNSDDEISQELLKFYQNDKQSIQQKQPTLIQKSLLPYREEPPRQNKLETYLHFSEYSTHIQTYLDMDSINRRLEDIAKLVNGQIIPQEADKSEFYIENTTELLQLYQPLRSGLQFYESKQNIVINMTRIKGDYISFMDFFTIVYNYFK
ncbi:protein kinase domain containing protein [Stylonychia lemnae]|uniref:Protein kinase domain containing protein n=1 Tax=Stylonychia lemnae TaxID=5949 RepID=A0A078A5Y5_STYLE|nr:protein kinase domain containing protein [Stylonychia lemnae]|eukprot:CDW76169.1 protein kinase domain containing protein [Stylonychia lemnae]